MHIKELIKETKRLEWQMVELKNKYTANKVKIQEFFDKKDIKQIEVEADEGLAAPLVASKVESLYIEYFADKLKAALDKERYSEVVVKTYTINNMSGLVELLKSAGVSPKEFKEYLVVSEVPDKEKIKQLYSMGEITKQQLKGCYKARLEKSIRIKEKKGGTN